MYVIFHSCPLPPPSLLLPLHPPRLQGCFTAIPLAFILPTASFLKLSKRGRWYSRERVIAFLVLIFGVIVMFIGTSLAIVRVSYGLSVGKCIG